MTKTYRPRGGVIALQHYQGDVEFREIWIKRLGK